MAGAEAKPADAADAAKPAEAAPAADAAKKISMDEVKKIKDSALLVGPKDAKILIVEYSEFQCPFCKRHHDNGTLKALVDKYPGKVAKTLKQFPLGFHQYAQKAGEAAYCFANGTDADKYYKFADGVFAKTLTSDAVPFDVAKELGANEAEFKTCVDSGKFAQRVKDDMAEGQRLFGVTGTPGNVILNTESGEYVVVAGAYPASEFEKTLDLWTK
jgi:protein-disulfide isomerase